MGKTTLSSEKRQNRMELAERICRETENFYEKTWGTPCKDGSIFLRYMNEVMDECEKLPDDRTIRNSARLCERSAGEKSWIRGAVYVSGLPDFMDFFEEGYGTDGLWSVRGTQPSGERAA